MADTTSSDGATVAPHTHDLADINWPDLADDADVPEGHADDEGQDAVGPPYAGGNEQENPRGMARFSALSATRRAGFPAGSGAQRSMDAIRGRR